MNDVQPVERVLKIGHSHRKVAPNGAHALKTYRDIMPRSFPHVSANLFTVRRKSDVHNSFVFNETKENPSEWYHVCNGSAGRDCAA